MSMPDKIYAFENMNGDICIDTLDSDRAYIREGLVDNLIDAIENFQCSGGLSIAIKGSIEAIRGEQ